MNIRILFLLLVTPVLASGQNYISTEFFVENAQINSLTEYIPSYVEVTGQIENLTDELLYIIPQTQDITMPTGWTVNEANLLVEDGNRIPIQPGDSYNLFLFAEIFFEETEAIFDKGTQLLNIRAEDADGNLLTETTETLCYQFDLANVPSPTFYLSNFDDHLEVADTIYVPIEISDPFSRQFWGFAEWQTIDAWGIERYLIMEPMEIITENIEEIICQGELDPIQQNHDLNLCSGDTINTNIYFTHFLNFEGKLAPTNDYRYEILVNVYDPVDSLNSNQQIRFIARDANCINGQEASIVDSHNQTTQICAGQEVTLTANPGFENITWQDQNNNQSYTGNSVTFTDIQQNISLYVTSRDAEGCLSYQWHYIIIAVK